jgi:hypothetical protein
MLRILRLLSYAAVALAVWLGALQLDLPRGLHIAALLVRVRSLIMSLNFKATGIS